MSCNECGEKPKRACGVFPRAVIEIDNPEQITLLRKVIIPVSMGDDTTVPPVIGKYHNVLLYYEANSKSYLYSSDGIPTLLVNGVTDYEAATNLPQINGVTLLGDKSAADLGLADAPMVITVAAGNTSWSGADTAEDVYNFFLNKGKVNIIFNGEVNYSYEIASAAYIPGEEKMMCTLAVATIVTGEPTEFEGNALFGTMTLYTADKAIDVSQIELQPKLYIADFTGLDLNYNELSGVPATSASIGMVKPGDGLEVASDGTLSISDIEQYAHFFDTVANMKQASNLVDGSYVKTYGYKRLGDGVYNLYKIRNKQLSDVIDGYNVVEIDADNTIVAERIQRGSSIVCQIKSTDNIQDYLSLPDDKEIVLTSNITIDSAIRINSNTTLNLNGYKITYTGLTSISIFTYQSTDTFLGYNGNKNICIRDGNLTGGCISMLHSANVNIENVVFEKSTTRHYIQFAGCRNVTIKGCTFNGTKVDDSGVQASECINIDPCNYGGQPYIDPASPMYDYTKNLNVYILNNKFNTATDNGWRYTNAIGTHSGIDEQETICENLTIDNNNFGSPFSICINLCDYINVKITNNFVDYDTDSMTDEIRSPFIFVRRSINNIYVENNHVVNANSIYYEQRDGFARANATISNNYFNGDSKDGAVIWFRTNSNSVVSDNEVLTNNQIMYIDPYIDIDEGYVPSTETHDLKVVNNTFALTASVRSMFIIRGNCYNLTFNNNSFNRSNSTYRAFSTQYFDTLSNIVIQNNTSNFKRYLIPKELFSSDVKNNGCLFELLSSTISQANTTLTLEQSIANMQGLVLAIGASSNWATVELNGYLPSRENLQVSFTWKFPTISQSGVADIVTVSSDNTGLQLSYASTQSPLRMLFAKI